MYWVIKLFLNYVKSNLLKYVRLTYVRFLFTFLREWASMNVIESESSGVFNNVARVFIFT